MQVTKRASRISSKSAILVYMSLIAKCSLKYTWPSLVVYDLHFRQDAAEVGLKDWLKVECFAGAAIGQDI